MTHDDNYNFQDDIYNFHDDIFNFNDDVPNFHHGTYNFNDDIFYFNYDILNFDDDLTSRVCIGGRVLAYPAAWNLHDGGVCRGVRPKRGRLRHRREESNSS